MNPLVVEYGTIEHSRQIVNGSDKTHIGDFLHAIVTSMDRGVVGVSHDQVALSVLCKRNVSYMISKVVVLSFWCPYSPPDNPLTQESQI